MRPRVTRSVRGWCALLGVATVAPFAPARSAAPVSSRMGALTRADGTAAEAMTGRFADGGTVRTPLRLGTARSPAEGSDRFLEFTTVVGNSYEAQSHR